MRKKYIVESGQVFGQLTLICLDGRRGHNLYWTCQCACGTTKTVSQSNLVRGLSASCGCVSRKKLADSRRTHGMSQSNEYQIWHGMLERCHNLKSMHYVKYGAKGTYVDDDWRYSFEHFYRDMGPRPSKQHSVDRIDPFGPYSKDNCRWATADVQANNIRARASIGHRTFSVAELARSFSIPAKLVYKRLDNNWSIYDALTVPRGEKSSNRLVTFNQVTLSLADWSRITGIEHHTLQNRLNSGVKPEEALTTKVRAWPGKRGRITTK